MTPSSQQQVLAFVRAGRFSDALSQLVDRKRDWQGSSRDLYNVLVAEMLQKTGQTRQGVQTAVNCLKSNSLTPSLRARCHIVLGTVDADEGAARRAFQHFQKAIEFAKADANVEQLCWAQLKLMIAMCDDSGPDAVSGLLGELRRNVERLGDPLVTAALHLFVAEVETKRSFSDRATHHIKIANSILGSYPNAWLEAVAANDALCVSFIASDIEGALSHATNAIRCANVAGYASGWTAAISNLAHIHVARGDLDEANRHLLEALRTSSEGGRTQAGILDGLARVKLRQGDLTECERILEQIGTVGDGKLSDLSYSKLGSFETRLRLLHRLGHWSEANKLASEVIPLALQAAERRLITVFKLLNAEAILMSGELEQAVAGIAEAMEHCADRSLDTVAEIERVAGKALAQAGHVAQAAARFERGIRVLSSVGNITGRAELIGDYSQVLWRQLSGGEMPAETSAASIASPLAPPGQLGVRIDAISSLLADHHAPSASVLDGAAAMLDFAGRPELLGREAASLLIETNCVKQLVLVATSPKAEVEILAWSGCNYDRARALAADGGAARVSLGPARDREVELVIEPAPDLASRSALLAVRKLTAAARALEAARREQQERAALWPAESLEGGDHGIFAAERMVELLTTARKIASTSVTVLVTGETGTGKEVIARVIHENSPRSGRPFLPVNCHAVPRDMLDSQLFGHRRGAFTGAQEHFSGVIRAAGGGTLFLDEIGELGPDVQPKLLRFLESGEIHPLGEPHPVKVDVRVIAATNVNLDQLVRDGRFREDLFYRINIIRFHIPPLRERREEIPLFVQYFLKRFSDEFQKGELRVAEETMEYLLLYGWPGNVRQMANEMRRLAALAEKGAILMPEHLSSEIAATRRTRPASQREPAPTEVVVRLDQPMAAAIEHVERAMLQHALKAAGGRMEKAARSLGLSRKGLYLKRHRLGLHA